MKRANLTQKRMASILLRDLGIVVAPSNINNLDGVNFYGMGLGWEAKHCNWSKKISKKIKNLRQKYSDFTGAEVDFRIAGLWEQTIFNIVRCGSLHFHRSSAVTKPNGVVELRLLRLLASKLKHISDSKFNPQPTQEQAAFQGEVILDPLGQNYTEIPDSYYDDEEWTEDWTNEYKPRSPLAWATTIEEWNWFGIQACFDDAKYVMFRYEWIGEREIGYFLGITEKESYSIFSQYNRKECIQNIEKVIKKYSA